MTLFSAHEMLSEYAKTHKSAVAEVTGSKNDDLVKIAAADKSNISPGFLKKQIDPSEDLDAASVDNFDPRTCPDDSVTFLLGGMVGD